ncbi:MAG: serA 2 [Planctomycetaceae bacterium]|nr:serA 2 [Planctomycetaceae bacterium]
MPKVACTALSTDEGPHLEIFTKAGFEVSFPPPGVNCFNEDHLITVLQDCDAVVAGSEPYTRRVISSLPKLRVIARRGVGFDAVDLAAADDHNIAVATTPGVLDESVAEHTIAMLLACARGFPSLDRQVREGRWLRAVYPRAAGKTLGIVGLGRIGQAVVPKAQGIGMQVIAYDPFPNHEFAKKHNVEFTTLDDLLARSEFVSLHLAMSPESFNLINKNTLAKMQRGAILINTGRGQLINEDDLCEALKSGQLAAAGLDVFQKEPLPLTSPLLQLDNVLLSGHIAGLDKESNYDIAARFAETILTLYRGGWPAECIRNLKGRANWKF